jgi:hypothetical protein
MKQEHEKNELEKANITNTEMEELFEADDDDVSTKTEHAKNEAYEIPQIDIITKSAIHYHRDKFNRIQGSPTRSSVLELRCDKKACPGNLQESGKELQETMNSATTMTALLSTDVQTYTEWTLIPNRNGKGGTKHVSNRRKEQKNGPNEPKVGPKECHPKNEIGSQLI